MLTLNNIEVVYHNVALVLKGISLSVNEGSLVALLGPNGAGKTTTLRAITGLLALHDGKTTRGDVRLNDRPLGGLSTSAIVRQGVAQVLENRRVFAELTVRDNLIAGAACRRGGASRDDLAMCYDLFPILGKRQQQAAGYLSGGEQQMLALARALMSRPRLLLLDEPSLGLAPMVAKDVANLIATINRRGVSILLVEQNAALALEIANYGYVLENGRIVADGTSDSLLQDEDVRDFYLGAGSSGSYKNAKRYRRRRRWLS